MNAFTRTLPIALAAAGLLLAAHGAQAASTDAVSVTSQVTGSPPSLTRSPGGSPVR